MELVPRMCVTYYRLAMAYFRANRRHDAQEALRKLGEAITQPWIVGSLVPLVKEHPMFAQWAAARNLAGRTFRDMIERQRFVPQGSQERTMEEPAASRYPTVVARSLGAVSVAVGGREVSDEAWASMRAKEMFFLLLAHRGGLRKEEAVELLYPELAREKCNSAFHSNLYRVRRALFAESVVRRDGTYLLNPDGMFEWDVTEFEEKIGRAQQMEPGSRERATAFQEAIALYQGPFAEAFFSEWARGIRAKVEQQANESLALLAGYFASRADYESAVLCMERVLRANRYNEEAAFQVARFRAAGGQAAAALEFLDEYRERYEQDLGAVLPPRFGSLRADIAAGKAG
jgi:two-component SAPR family response regulator